MTHPIKTLAKSMSSNTPDSPALELSGCMEVSVLVDAFNQMNDNLNGHIKCTLLTDYVTMVSKCASLEVYTLKKQVESCLYQTIHALDRASFDMEDINREKLMFFCAIDISDNYLLLNETIREIFQKLSDKVQDEIQRRDQDLLYRIKEYIIDNCERELKLSDIAQTFHLNYSYLSFRFHQHYNEHFSEFL